MFNYLEKFHSSLSRWLAQHASWIISPWWSNDPTFASNWPDHWDNFLTPLVAGKYVWKSPQLNASQFSENLRSNTFPDFLIPSSTPLIPSSSRPFILSPPHPLIPSYTHPLIHSYTHTLILSPSHPLTLSTPQPLNPNSSLRNKPPGYYHCYCFGLMYAIKCLSKASHLIGISIW